MYIKTIRRIVSNPNKVKMRLLIWISLLWMALIAAGCSGGTPAVSQPSAVSTMPELAQLSQALLPINEAYARQAPGMNGNVVRSQG